MSARLEYEESSPVDNEYFFIGIDFGTTYTGVAWSTSRTPDNIQVIQTWPGKTHPKVPSTIRYQNDGSKTWGFHASPDDPATLQWFKLLLVDDKDLTQDVRTNPKLLDAKAALKKAGKQPQEVVKDYLSLIWEYTIESMCRELTQAVVDGLPFRVVLTIPATWGKVPKASERLVQAAKQAGILARRQCGSTELNTVHEPEAAAFATLKDARPQGVLESNDIFVMCDAGGGTVVSRIRGFSKRRKLAEQDLVTYVMKDRYRMEVEECVEGDGDICGSIFVDEKMEECLGEWLGKRWTSLPIQKRREFRNDKWTTIKCNFDGTGDQPSHAVIGRASTTSRLIPSRRKAGPLKVEKDSIYFDKITLETIFSRVIKQVVALVGKQISSARVREQRSPKVIIMVGGLGGSRYLYHKLKTEFPNLLIIQRDGDRPVTAICRGAVLKARSISDTEHAPTVDELVDREPTAPSVISRIPLLSYGVSFLESFVEGRHNAQDKVFDAVSQKHIATELMHWYVKKGKNVLETDRPTYTFRRCLRSPPPGNQFSVQIWECPSPEPPDSRKGRNDIIRCINVICSIDRPFEDLPYCENRDYREILFQLDLDVQRLPRLQFLAKMNGRIRGRGELIMEFA